MFLLLANNHVSQGDRPTGGGRSVKCAIWLDQSLKGKTVSQMFRNCSSVRRSNEPRVRRKRTDVNQLQDEEPADCVGSLECVVQARNSGMYAFTRATSVGFFSLGGSFSAFPELCLVITDGLHESRLFN